MHSQVRNPELKAVKDTLRLDTFGDETRRLQRNFLIVHDQIASERLGAVSPHHPSLLLLS
jgi:hypothetical protein